MWACIACALLNIIIIGILTTKFKRDNKKAAEGKIVIEGSEVCFLLLFEVSLLICYRMVSVTLTSPSIASYIRTSCRIHAYKFRVLVGYAHSDLSVHEY